MMIGTTNNLKIRFMKHIVSICILVFLPLYISAQFRVAGVVTDDTGEPLLGATVYETGNTVNGVITGLEGDFVLTVPSASSQITVQYIGYKAITQKVEKNIKIVLQNDEFMLQEVTVLRVGFGSKSRITNAASISQISTDQIRALPSTSIQNSLAGRLPGLFQLQGSGQPGKDAASIFIRGMGTFAEGVDVSPLILIDDVESDLSTLSRLATNDIEEISILKDAGSTSIFGIKGANGVILVTTRRGKIGKPKMTLRTNFGFQQPTYKNEFLNSYESLSLLKELHLNNNNTTALAQERYFSDTALEHYRLRDNPYRYPDVDWYDLLYRRFSTMQQYTADVQGGTEAVKYFVSLSYLDQGGLFKDQPKTEHFNNDYYQKRYNVRANFDISITEDFTVRLNANAILTEINSPVLPAREGSDGIFKRILGAGIAPYHYPAYNPNGSFGGYTGTVINPLAAFTYGGYTREFRNNVNGNITLDYNLRKITQGLKAKGVMALTNTWGFERNMKRTEVLDYYYEPETESYAPVVTNQYILPLLAVSNSGYSPMVQINTRFDVSYNRRFDKHNVSSLVLGNWYSTRTGSGNQRNSVSYSGRVGYDYDYRYILELSAAYNGSDEFSEENRYDLFPSITLGWNLAQEPYFKSIANQLKIETLKLRGSYGFSGSDKISGKGYAYQESYGQVMDYYFGENPTKLDALGLMQYPNPDMRWETDAKADIGIDLRMFKDRLSISVDYFNNKRKDILATRAGIVYYAGFLNVFTNSGGLITILPPSNIGRTENQGWDGEISWRDSFSDKFNYFVRGTFSYAKNKIVYMDEAPSEYKLSMQTGRPIGTIFGYVADGFYNSQEDIDNSPYDGLDRGIAPGDIKYKDISGPNGAPDGIINEYDRVPIGNDLPDFTYGISSGITYGNFDLSVMFQGATGAKVSIESMLRLASGTNSIVGSQGKPMPIHLGRWTYYDADGNYVNNSEQLTAMNKNASYPRLMPGNQGNSAQSTFWLRSANYLRWKNLELGYNLPKNSVKTIGVESIRIYFTSQNLYTWSQLKDYQIDPESSRSGLTTYPQQRVFNMGCQVSF